MNKNILETGIQNFIEKNWNTDIVSVLLKKPIFDTVSQAELAQQFEGKKKSENKLPTWFNTPNIYYPKSVNIEQTSSEVTAAYKAHLVSGKTLVDLTGGLGVDAYFFSKKIDTVFHCEINDDLAEIAAHNFDVLDAKNVSTQHQDGLKFLKGFGEKVDWVYSDPSRRDESGGRIFRLADCLPNIPKHLDAIFQKTDHVLLKTAPLLDLQQGINELAHVKEIHVVAVKNEVKELLWILEKSFSGHSLITTVNLETNHSAFSFQMKDESTTVSTYSKPKQYLYEPNTAILKAGAFKLIGNRYGLDKLHEHSHLYTSDELMNFPGRTFKIESVLPYNRKSIKELNIKKANVTTRNFSESVTQIRKKHKIKDGGNVYLFFTTNLKRSLIILKCLKITHNPT